MEYTFGSQRIKYLTDKEVRRHIAKSANPLLFEFIYYLGLRRGEVGLIRRDDVESRGVWVTVLKSARKGGDRERYFMPLEGGLKRRILELKMSHSHDYLFPGYNGTGITGGAIAKMWNKVCKSAGVHCLRHSRAVRLYEAGYSAEEAMTWLRHKSIASTLVYYKVTGSRMKSIAQAMAR